MLTLRALTHVAACYGDDRAAPLALMAACPAARAAVEYSAAGAVMACDGVVVRRRHDASVPDAPVYMQSHTCELTVDRWDRQSAAAVTAALWWLLRATLADAGSALQPRLSLCVRAMHDGDALPRAADDDDDGPARPLDARVRGVRVQTRWRDVYARLCAVRVLHSDGAVDVSALRDTAAQLTVLQLCGTAATAALDWLPQCAQLQELTLQCSERCADVDSRRIDLSALTQLRACTLFIDGRICIDLRGCRALRDAHVCRYYIVDNDVSSVAACTTLMLYRISDDDVLDELAVTAYTDAIVAARWLYRTMYCKGSDYHRYLPERSVLVVTSVTCDLHWLARCTQLEAVCIRHMSQDKQHDGNYSALAALPRLRKLDFHGPCVDLRTVAQCAQLEELVLCEGRCIGDFSVLASAPHMRKVALVEPTHALFRSLRHCTQLEELELYADYDETYTRDKEMLTKLRHLRSVKLKNASSDMVDMVSRCRCLEVVELLYSETTSYGRLFGMPRLRELKIDSKYCDDFSWIMGLTYLEKLDVDVDKNTIEYYVPRGLPRLRELRLNAVDEEHIKYIALSTQLVKLRLCTGNVDCTPLRALTQLRELHLSVRQLYNTNALSHCTQLVSLSIQCDEHLCDVPCLDALTQLRRLYIRPKGVSDLRWVASCTHLHLLSVTLYAEGMDYSPLGALTQLRNLSIEAYGTVDVSWIVHCTQLEVLDLRYDSVVQHDVLGALPRLRVLELCWSTPADLGWLARCTQLEKVTFCPHNCSTPLASLAQLRELGLCDIGEADYKGKNSVTLWRNEAQASAPHDGTAPVHYRFTYATR